MLVQPFHSSIHHTLLPIRLDIPSVLPCLAFMITFIISVRKRLLKGQTGEETGGGGVEHSVTEPGPGDSGWGSIFEGQRG